MIGSVLCCMALAAGAQVTNIVTRPLSLKACIDLALEHNLDVQIERYSSQTNRYRLQAAYGIYDPVLSLQATRAYTDQPEQFDPKKTSPDSAYKLTDDSFGPGLAGRLPFGLSYDLSARAHHLDANTFFLTNAVPLLGFTRITNNYYATAGISLKQPLLKDFWIDDSRRSIEVRRKNLKISELNLRGQVMNTVTAVALAYYDLLFAREHLKVERKALELATELLSVTGTKVEAGALPPLDKKQAEAQVETIKTDLFAAEQAYVEQENLLKNLLTDSYQAWVDIKIEPSENLVSVEEPVSRAESWLLAMTQRPDLLQMRLDLEKDNINLRYSHNQLFPSLDVVGSYGVQSVDTGLGSTLGDLGSAQNPFYSFGVVLSYPLGNTAARNNYKASQAAKKQSLLRLKKLEQDIITQVDTAVKLAESNFKRVHSSRKAREFAQDALNAEVTKLQNGASTPFNVLGMQRTLTAAESAEVRALADYGKAKVQLSLQEGTTLEKNKIDLNVK